MRLPVPGRLQMRKRLLPCEDVEDVPVTEESIQAAKEAMWQERYQVQLMTGVIITDDCRIILPKGES